MPLNAVGVNWSIRTGTVLPVFSQGCFPQLPKEPTARSGNCDPQEFTFPTAEYSRSSPEGLLWSC